MTRDQAYEHLKRRTLQDFGYDVEAWRQWFEGKTLFEAMPGIVTPKIVEERHAFLIERLEDFWLVDALREHPENSVLLNAWRVTKEIALEELRRRTGQDFGFDAEAWQQWFDENADNIPR